MDKTIEPEIDALLAKTPFHLPGVGLCRKIETLPAAMRR